MKHCHRKFVYKLRSSFSGLTPEKIALAVVVGLVLGAFPLFGLPTVLCGLAAPALRVSFPVLQLMNQVMTPVQLLLLLPLSRVGSWIFGASAGLGGKALSAVAGWFCLCIPAGILLYFAVRLILRTWHRPRLPRERENPYFPAVAHRPGQHAARFRNVR